MRGKSRPHNSNRSYCAKRATRRRLSSVTRFVKRVRGARFRFQNRTGASWHSVASESELHGPQAVGPSFPPVAVIDPGSGSGGFLLLVLLHDAEGYIAKPVPNGA